MAMLEMLTEVIRSEKLLCLIAFAVLVYNIKMISSDIPVWWVGELVATESTNVGCATRMGCLVSTFDTR